MQCRQAQHNAIIRCSPMKAKEAVATKDITTESQFARGHDVSAVSLRLEGSAIHIVTGRGEKEDGR